MSMNITDKIRSWRDQIHTCLLCKGQKKHVGNHFFLADEINQKAVSFKLF